MILPHAEQAVVDVRKLREYILNPQHERGQHKARLFAAVFGLTAADAEALRAYLLQAVRTHEVQRSAGGAYGQTYWVDLPLTWRGVTGQIRTIWLVRHGEAFPRFVSCFVIRKGREA